MPSGSSPRVDPAIAEELRSLARAYASGVDRRDRDVLLSAFHPDATLTVVRAGDRDTLSPAPVPMHGHGEIGAITDRIAVYSHTLHLLGQSGYHLDDVGATGEVACIAHHRWRDEVDLDHVMYIRYDDEYRVGDDDRWRISSRTVVVDWTETRVVDVPGRRPR